MRTGLKWFSVFTSIGMFLVLLAGALVTKTESGRGCGDDWPLCNGKFIPAYTLESIIEYSHRAVTGVVGLMVLITAVWVWQSVQGRKDIQLYSLSALFFTLLQAVLGAMAVVWEQSSAVMALHFGFSLIAFASTLLLAVNLWRMDQPAHTSGWGVAYPQEWTVSKGFRNGVWLTAIYTYFVVYVGAFVRHTESSGGCGTSWPTCNGKWIPDWSYATTISFAHRIVSIFLLVMTIWVVYKAYRDYADIEPIRSSAKGIGIFGVIQILSGGLVAITLGSENVYLFASMFHTMVVCIYFGILCHMCFLTWRMGGQRDAVYELA